MDTNTQTLDPADAVWLLSHMAKPSAGWTSACDLAHLVGERPYGAEASVTDLAHDLGMARTTVSGAIARLVDARVLIYEPGSGSAPSWFRLNPDVRRWSCPWRAGRSSVEIVTMLVARRQTVPHTRLVSAVRPRTQPVVPISDKGRMRAISMSGPKGRTQPGGGGRTQGQDTTPDRGSAYVRTQGQDTNGGRPSSSSSSGDPGGIPSTGGGSIELADAEKQVLSRLRGLLYRATGGNFLKGEPLELFEWLFVQYGAEAIEECIQRIPGGHGVPAAVVWIGDELSTMDVTGPGYDPDEERIEWLHQAIATREQLLSVDGLDGAKRFSLEAELGVWQNELQDLEARHGAPQPAQ